MIEPKQKTKNNLDFREVNTNNMCRGCQLLVSDIELEQYFNFSVDGLECSDPLCIGCGIEYECFDYDLGCEEDIE